MLATPRATQSVKARIHTTATPSLPGDVVDQRDHTSGRDIASDRQGGDGLRRDAPWLAMGARVEAPVVPAAKTLLRPPMVPAPQAGCGVAPIRILVEMRPAFDGHAGIPQETRLLFRGLSQLPNTTVEGLIQSSNRVIAKGLPDGDLSRWQPNQIIDRLSRLVVSLQPNPTPSRAEHRSYRLQMALQPIKLLLGTVLGLKTRLTRFEAAPFKDFVWRSMFSKTLPIEDFSLVTSARFRVARVPWAGLHRIGLMTRAVGGPIYPRFKTADVDVLIAETPFPGRVSGRTRLVVRYHDAIPLLMPHTIIDRSYHRASHYHALKRNLEDGAWFACVSDATRRDLISIFPEAAERAVTISNMVSHHYFAEDSSPGRVTEIFSTRRNMGVHQGAVKPLTPSMQGFSKRTPKYLLMVSTLEPRKNHLTLLAAWEQLRTLVDRNLQLVFVGGLGWDHHLILAKLMPWLKRGGLHLLEDVPAAELRILYRHAAVTVCPSYAEGFDFSGVESMRCGGLVASSDIPVHRDVYGEASEYFDPYSVDDIARVVGGLLVPSALQRRAELVRAGAEVSEQYTPERILPQWQVFLERITR
jgi:glycosyltransferase involved in cell wall biosynthesis